ncbi:hypothetical protein [Amylibacter marinus]|nr:hypothetical protein [Amylibacter marinus]
MEFSNQPVAGFFRDRLGRNHRQKLLFHGNKGNLHAANLLT